MNQRPIFILGAHKSGTSLLRSLFDNHSQLFSIPFETHVFQNLHYWVDYNYRKQYPNQVDNSKLIKSINNWVSKVNKADDRYSDGNTKNILDIELFKDYLYKNLKPDLNNEQYIIDKYFEAAYFSISQKPLPGHIRIVEKSVEHAEFAVHLEKMYPDAFFIRILRNPYSNIVSLRKFKSIEFGYPLINRIIKTLYNSYYFLYKNRNLINNYYLVKYEDLITNPEEEIRKICDFVQIDFEPILLTPTVKGIPWGGNSMTDREYTGIDNRDIDQWKNEIHPYEVFLVNKLFSFVLDDFDYEHFPVQGTIWKPAKGEGFFRYLYNRLFKLYLNYF